MTKPRDLPTLVRGLNEAMDATLALRVDPGDPGTLDTVWQHAERLILRAGRLQLALLGMYPMPVGGEEAVDRLSKVTDTVVAWREVTASWTDDDAGRQIVKEMADELRATQAVLDHFWPEPTGPSA